MRFLTPLLLGALALGSSTAFSQAFETIVPNEGPGPAYTPGPTGGPRGTILQDQRSLLVTNPGAGAGGADVSRAQDTSLAMTLFGFGAQQVNSNRVADDFVVPAGGYTINTVTVYSYQTNSTTTPTHNGMTFRIWNGVPGAMGSTVVFGDTTTNRFTSAAFANIFRTLESTGNASTNRPIMAVSASGLNINLPAGTYWLDFSLSGSLASGPWAPPITIVGQTTTGNGLQSLAGGAFDPVTDVGPQGFPITLEGTLPGTDLVTTLTDTPDPVTAGSNVTYQATVNNAGPADATDVAVALPLAAGTNFVSAAPGLGGTCVTPAVGANGTVTCTWAGNTANGTQRDVTVVASVPANTANATVLSVTATATSTTNELDPPDNAATTTTTVATSADVSITITDSPDPVTAGQNLTYTVTVSNNGPSDAQAVAVSLPAPAGTTLVSGPAGPIGTLAAGASVQSLYVFAVSPAVLSGTTITGTASVTSTTTDPNTANNSASTTTGVIAVADLSVTLTSSATQALINVPVTFTAVSTNGGPSDAQNVSVTITLTPDFRYSGHTATGATCTTPQIGNTGAIVCTWAGATAPGATRTLSVVAFSNVEGNTAVNASTTSATTDPVANNNATGVSVVVGYPFTEIPTLSQFGLMLLGLLVALMGFVAVRRQA
ncbi:MAG: hypothetical protein AMXMBFR25_16250 [Lysobacterales bacterium]|nr:hypothetical protein [Xanthomonadales bacterium]